MHPRLAGIAQYVDGQRAELLATAERLPASQWATRPQPDRWSVSDVCEHLHRVERGAARLIAKLASEARASGHPAETEEGSLLGSLDHARLTVANEKLISPERVAPEGGWSKAAALAALAESRDALRKAIVDADGLALQSVRYEHPRLGTIDLYQWILFVGQHEARHGHQVAEIVAAIEGAA